MTQDKMRAEFEAWALTQINMLLDQSKTYHGEYGCEKTQNAWLAWQAAQKREPLSDEQIEPIAIDVLGYGALSEPDMELFTQSVRAIEAAHNITKE